MPTVVTARFTITSPPSDPRVGMVRDDGYRFDFLANAFVAGTTTLTNLQAGVPLAPLYPNCYDYVAQVPTTSLPATQATYTLQVLSGATPVMGQDSVVMTIANGLEVTGGTSTVTGPVTVGGYATGQDPATLLLVNPANKLLTDSSGHTSDASMPTLLGLLIAAVDYGPVVSATSTAVVVSGLTIPPANLAVMWATITDQTSGRCKGRLPIVSAVSSGGNVQLNFAAPGWGVAPLALDTVTVE